jgi:hypothetical protein
MKPLHLLCFTVAIFAVAGAKAQDAAQVAGWLTGGVDAFGRSIAITVTVHSILPSFSKRQGASVGPAEACQGPNQGRPDKWRRLSALSP